MLKKIFLLTAITLICSSCEAPTTITSRGLDSDNEKEKAIMQGIALETYYNRVEKLNNIAWPILSSSLDFCKKNIADTIGIEVISLNEIDKNYRNAASEKIGLTNGKYLGNVLKETKKWWIKKDFKPDRKQCVNKSKLIFSSSIKP